MLSMLLFIVMLVEFLLMPQAATSTFFLLMMIAFVDGTVLHPRVEALDFVFEAQFEIGELTATIDEERVLLVGGLLFGGRLADDRPVLDAPEHLVAIPLGERSAVKKRFKPGVIRRVQGERGKEGNSSENESS